jgi:hypothetical protein
VSLSPSTDCFQKAIEIVERHKRHVELSPGVGEGVQTYALLVCDDILDDLRTLRDKQ